MNLEDKTIWSGEDHIQIAKDANGKLINDERFDWKEYSWVVAKYCPQCIDNDKFNWEKHSWAVALYRPQLLDEESVSNEKFNWEEQSWAVAKHCPQKFDTNKFNWKEQSWAVAEYCPEHFDKDLYNWEEHSWAIAKHWSQLTNLNTRNKMNNKIDIEKTNNNSTPLIFKAINNVMRDVGAVAKDQFNSLQKYKFRGIDDVYNAIQRPMVENGLFVIPNVIEKKIEAKGKATLATLTVEYTFYAMDGSSLKTIVIGEGVDYSDKAVNKAMSAAMKYAYLQIFCIPTEEKKDSEHDSIDIHRDDQKKIDFVKPNIGFHSQESETAKIREEVKNVWAKIDDAKKAKFMEENKINLIDLELEDQRIFLNNLKKLVQ